MSVRWLINCMTSFALRRCVLLTLVAVSAGPMLLAGCAQSQSAAFVTASHLASGAAAAKVDSAPLNPAIRYLRVTVNRAPTLLALGFVDADAHGRPVEVWFSADREVLRLQDGRLSAVLGTAVEWRRVGLPVPLPAWHPASGNLTFLRTRDEMPGYRIGLREQMTRHAIAPQQGTELRQWAPDALQWYEEQARLVTEDGEPAGPATAAAPVARYAVKQGAGTPEVVYGEQCVSAEICLTWQPWPPRGLNP